jgi:hypothetical protein
MRHKDNTASCPKTRAAISCRFVTVGCVSIFYKQGLCKGVKSVCNEGKGF